MNAFRTFAWGTAQVSCPPEGRATCQPHLQDVPTAAGLSAPCEHAGAEQSVWSNQSCQVPEEGGDKESCKSPDTSLGTR